MIMKRRKQNYGKYLVNACQQTPQILIATPGKWHGSKDSKLDFNKLGNDVPKCLCQMPNFLGNTSVRSTPTGRANNPFMQIQPRPNFPQPFQTPPSHSASSGYSTPPSQQSPITPRRHFETARPANKVNRCTECRCSTKYMCVNCPTIICNACSTPADPLECQNYNEEGEIR